jgi:hypothetical protein
MREIGERELFRQLREFVELLAAEAADQKAWLCSEHVPVDEMMLQLDDAVPAWFPRLEQAGLIGTQAENALRSLLDFVLSLPSAKALWQDDALDDAPEWQQIRKIAGHTLSVLDAPSAGTLCG